MRVSYFSWFGCKVDGFASMACLVSYSTLDGWFFGTFASVAALLHNLECYQCSEILLDHRINHRSDGSLQYAIAATAQ